MRIIAFAIAVAITVLPGQGGAQQQPSLPPGHPPVAPAPQAAADPRDVESIDAIIGAWYASVSGPAGAPRQWERFRSLFAPEARLIAARPDGPVALTPQQFCDLNRAYFEKGGYFETPVHQHVDAYGTIAQVFSTFESRRRVDDPQPYARGINSIQLLQSGGRWWITSAVWEHERPDVQPIPPQFLPGALPGAAPEP